MSYVFRILFIIGLLSTGVALLFFNRDTIKDPETNSHPRPHKLKSTDLPKPVPPPPPKKPKPTPKTATLEKPLAPPSNPFSGVKSFGAGSGHQGLQQETDASAAASGALADSKSAKNSSVQILSMTDPQFPEAAKKNNISGYVRLQITIDPSSSIKSIEILDAQPKGYFETAAIESVKNWKFTAAYSGGSPVESVIKRRIEFKLE